jgi:hypothetical protein
MNTTTSLTMNAPARIRGRGTGLSLLHTLRSVLPVASPRRANRRLVEVYERMAAQRAERGDERGARYWREHARELRAAADV